MTTPSGRAVHLTAGEYEAVVVEVGGGLRSLTRANHDIVDGYGPEEMCNSGRGQQLIPWPNRIRDGRYTFGGRAHQLPLSEPARHNASHGLVRWANWSLLDHDAASALWGYTLHPQPGYPFLLELTLAYQLSAEGLTVDVSATNTGDDPAPYGHGAHPYLTVGRRIDDCELTLPATTWCDADEQLIPLHPEPVDGSRYDFTTTRRIGDTRLDHAFSGLTADADGLIRATLSEPGTGRATTLWAEPGYPWLQVFSGDTLQRGARQALAVEPMTCPADAFNSGTDLIVLRPGDSHTARYGITATG